MSDSVLPRPGLLAGVYPQREETRASLLEKLMASATGVLQRWSPDRHPGLRRFVNEVETKARDLDRLDDEQLTARVRELSRALYAAGLRRDLVAESFAIIREVAGRRTGMRHYSVQLYGAWAMLQGRVAEMDTGEGKTLTATLAAGTAALAGIPVHVVTVNDFLAARDAQWMLPIYRSLGLSVGTVTEDLTAQQRQDAYSRHVTYCTNKQLVFDYLKDRMVLGQENRELHLNLEELHKQVPRTRRLLLRGLCFAIVDEADSVLVDEARTPLVISNRPDLPDQGLMYRHAVRIGRLLEAPRDFQVDRVTRQITLTDLGRAQVVRLSRSLGGVWAGRRRREELIRHALTALHLFELDTHYLVRDGRVQIVDEYTGRVMADRSWERGLHQMVEAKEGCEITGRQETLSRISYQRFFQRYLMLAGMTGTAREVAPELWSVYRLKVVNVPPNRAVRRRFAGNRLYLTADRKWHDVVERSRALHERGQPVLIGTRSVAASETLSRKLETAGIPHRVLNARQNQQEAEIIAQAGRRGRCTVATNMAGRGTDIRLEGGVVDLGGLHVLATERHEARRIDRQLFGRAGRQGDPGSYEAVMSLDDDLFRDVLGPRLRRAIETVAASQGRVHALPAVLLIRYAQWCAERRHAQLRRDLLRIDENLGDLLAFSGRGE